MNKICSVCKVSLDSSSFYKSKATKDGFQSTCKTCQCSRKEYTKAYREANKEKLSAQNKQWREENKDHVKERTRKKYLENVEEQRMKRREHYSENRALYLHYSKLRKYRINRASPSWLTTEMTTQIRDVYKESRRLTDSTGIPHEVDHIVPLKGETVCGLHVPWNLRVITKEENIRKFNTLDEELMEGIYG
jgi:5-methylcytosine-specific restriction endonuclease McrA